jgi:EAL domain-containing protein (putative c-di-GMP-specific phosphodiesterase class I)
MGKSLQPLNAMAVRPPANTPAASAAPAAAEPVTAESMGWQLRAALPPLRLHSVSLYDDQANVLWLSEGALGPDEHNLVLEAMDTLSNDRSMPCYENGLEDGRVAIFLPVRAPQGELVGVAMILADLKSVSDGVLERIVSPPVRAIMQKIAVLLRATAKTPTADAPAPIPVAVAPVLELAPDRTSPSARAAASTPAAAPAPAVAAKAASPAAAKPASNTKVAPAAVPAAAPLATKQTRVGEDASLSPQAIDDILEFELVPEVGAAAPAEKSAPKATPAAPRATTLAWDDSDAGLELVHEVSSAAQAEVAKSAPAASAPAAPFAPVLAPRANASATKAPAPVAPVVVPTAHPAPSAVAANAGSAPISATAAPSAVLALGSLEPPIPTAALVAPANVPTLSAAVPTSIPVAAPAIIEPSNAPPAPAANAAGRGSNDALSTTAVSVALTSSAGSNATTAAGAGSAKSTNATTTTRALSAVTSTGTTRALNGSGTASVPALNATGTTRAVSFDPSSLILDIQPFSKLRAGGRMRRYEVLPRIPHRDANRAPAAMDGLALQRLLGWLGSNRSAWSMEPTSFSLNLSISTLEDPKFPQQVASCLKANGIAADNLGFEIAEPLCTQHRAQVERFLSLCDKLGCFVVIDDFSFDSSVLPLLRSKALRLVKIDPKLTSVALKDKLSQAVVVAIVQAVKVLGIHCAAKRVESQASLQWLTGIGCDLAQGPALSQVVPIESLNMPQTPAPVAETPKAS